MKKVGLGLMIISICLMLSGCSLRCILGHSWKEATCTEPKTCTVCGETEGTSLGHDWNEHGECERCKEHKEYENSYGYFSELELYRMAKDAIKDAVYPVYVSNYETFPKYIEKISDERMGVGEDSFTVVGQAEFSSDGIVQQQTFAVIIEPRTDTKYIYKDHLVQ